MLHSNSGCDILEGYSQVAIMNLLNNKQKLSLSFFLPVTS